VSIFKRIELPCPTCSSPVTFELVHSVNADRRPDLREAILAGSFQRETCPSCSFRFRVEPEFSYIDIGRGQFIAAWPASKLGQWQAHEAHTQAAFDRAFGKDAPPEARELGTKLQVRAVFGWPALAEKLLAAGAGISDMTLELAKAGVAREMDDAPIGGPNEMRLLRLEGDQLVLGWVGTGNEEVGEMVGVPRSLIAEIEAEPGPWEALRSDLSGGPFVDLLRTLVPGDAKA
jgi:CpXC protein